MSRDMRPPLDRIADVLERIAKAIEEPPKCTLNHWVEATEEDEAANEMVW